MSLSEEIQDKAPKLLAWYPNQLAYTFNELSRMEMRANPLLKVIMTNSSNFNDLDFSSVLNSRK